MNYAIIKRDTEKEEWEEEEGIEKKKGRGKMFIYMYHS